MSLFGTASNTATTPVVPQDRYVFECLNVSEQPPYAPPGEQPKPDARPGIRWVFALYDTRNGERFYFNGEPYEFFQITSSAMQRGSRAREYVEALLGRELAEGEDVNPTDLLGKRGVGMVIWEIARTDKNKKICKLAGCEPYGAAGGANGSAAPTARAGRGPGGAAPSAVSVNASDTLALRETLRKKIRQAEILQTAEHLTWLALNVDTMSAPDCEEFIAAVQADIAAE